MRIGTIYTLYGRRAGAELFFERTVRGLLETFSDITFVVYCNNEAAECLVTTERGLGERLVVLQQPLLGNQVGKVLWLEYVSHRSVEAENLDVFWIPSGANSFPGRWRTPTVATFHDLGEYFVKGKYDTTRMFYRKQVCVPRTLRRAAALVAVSRSTAQDVESLFHPRQPCHVVYPGSSPRSGGEAALSPTEAETLKGMERIVFCPGRTDYRGKGLDVLLRGYARFRGLAHDAPPLVLVGPEGVGHKQFLTDIQELGLGNTAKYLGRVSDAMLDALYARSVAVVCASRYEGFGFPVTEAMQHGVPVICSRSGSLPEIAGGGALYFTPGDAVSLSVCMVRLWENAAVRRSLVSAASVRRRAFMWDRTCKAMRRIFELVTRRA